MKTRKYSHFRTNTNTNTKTHKHSPDSPELWITLPVHLFKEDALPKSRRRIIYVEDPWFFTYLPFNRVKLGYLMIAGRRYASSVAHQCLWNPSESESESNPVEDCIAELKSNPKYKDIHKIHMYDPIDIPCLKNWETLLKKAGKTLILHDSPAFLETRKDLEEYHTEFKAKSKAKTYQHTHFYQWQRRRLGLLYHTDAKTGKDIWTGGQLSFDKENREPFPEGLSKEPHSKSHSKSQKITSLERKLLEELTKSKNPGPATTKDLEEAIERYPLTSEEAMRQLRVFLKEILPNFGRYEDAIHPKIRFGYHSVLSCALNCGLLTPKQILEEIQGIPSQGILPSLEGYIRQVFGWRSYVRMVYIFERNRLLEGNALKHTRRLGKVWFERPPDTTSNLTKIDWLDDVIRNAHDLGYAHHIERLMILSNYFLLLQVHPRDVLRWFWTIISIDAYEWVMVPNVMGMGQYADGGMMMTRPYISSATYLQKMSRNTLKSKEIRLHEHKSYSWEEIWKGLYYGFLKKHSSIFKNQYSMASSIRYLWKTKNADKELHIKDAEAYISMIL